MEIKLSKTGKLLFVALLLTVFSSSCDKADNTSGNGGNGKGGSMARFTINNNHLYIVDHSDLQVLDISVATNPTVKNKTKIGASIETIYPYQNNLFIGSRNAMYIYNISNPENPAHLSTYWHVTSCDPVVVQGSFAYVTLRSGTACNTGQNLLEIIDISNLANPLLKNWYEMHNPHGLGIDGNRLFVCDGDAGLKIFQVEPNGYDLTAIKTFAGIKTYDVIPNNGNLIMTGADGIFQYSYSQTSEEINLLSTIPVVP